MPFWTHIPRPSACVRMHSEDSARWLGEGWGHGPRRSLARGKGEQAAHPEDQRFSILRPGIRAATAHEGHSLWGPAFCLPATHGGLCLWGAWPVWLWSGAFLGPSLGEPMVLMHTPWAQSRGPPPHSTSCLHLCPLFACGWSITLPISFALRTGNLGQPSTSHR